jgi:hypothetical protein
VEEEGREGKGREGKEELRQLGEPIQAGLLTTCLLLSYRRRTLCVFPKLYVAEVGMFSSAVVGILKVQCKA